MLGVTVLLCLSVSVVWSETIRDLVKRNGIFYKKFTDLPFNGKITGEYNGSFKNGLPDGPWVAYHENGQLWYKGNFKSGKKVGSWIRYWDNGKMENQGDFKNGKKEGFWVENWVEGQLRIKGDYKNGKKEGYWVGYDWNGNNQSFRTGNYKNDKRISD